MNFKKWVKSIQTAAYNGARTVVILHIYFRFSPVCRKDKKEGVCPKIMRTSSDCGRPDECSTDADCIGDKKCCYNDCGGKSCLPGTYLLVIRDQ